MSDGRPAGVVARPPCACCGRRARRTPTPRRREWYPPGTVGAVGRLFGVDHLGRGLLTLGTDSESYQRRAAPRAFDVDRRPDADRRRDRAAHEPSVRLPWSLIAARRRGARHHHQRDVNLWLAGRIVKFSGRLRRPWPDLNASALPPMTLVGARRRRGRLLYRRLFGIVAQLVAAAAADGLRLTGLCGSAHADARPQWTHVLAGGVYAVVIVFGWPVLGLSRSASPIHFSAFAPM